MSEAMKRALKENKKICRRLEKISDRSHDCNAMRDNVKNGTATIADVRRDTKTLKKFIEEVKKFLRDRARRLR